MRLPLRLPEYHPLQRWLAACAIAVLCAALGLLLWAPARILGAVRALDRVAYDSLYRLRAPDSKTAVADVVIVAVDDKSIEAVDALNKIGWPWPRAYWGKMVSYLDACGARAIVFDLLFDRSSVYNRPPANDDDHNFADAVDAASTPVILATLSRPDGSLWDVAPPVTRKRLGVANVSDEGVIRTYKPLVHGHPSLALETLKQIGATPPKWAQSEFPFYLRYYGPHAVGDTPATFTYVRAASLLAVADNPDLAQQNHLTEEVFKNKIVFVATITAGTYDLKASPLSPRYPGVEIHATAVQNMLADQQVALVNPTVRVGMLILGCLLAAVGTVIPARVPLKLAGGLAGAAVVIGITAGLFMGQQIRWLPPAASIVAATLAAFSGLAWSYFTEGRQRRFVLSALAQSVSREVADEIARDPRKLKLGGERRNMTVMFSDLANFTTLSEALPVEQLADTLHLYLEEMSGVIIEQNGYLDKYIGDAIMSFWNAPADQIDHALRACHAALEMQKREEALQPRLKELSGHELHSRIGINSGPMIVGNMGSPFKFAYTVLGDSVNLASRLEGANKMYGTRVLLSETTANLVRERFCVRKVDLLRVKGKKQPMGVYELVGEGRAEPVVADRIARYESALTLYQQRQFDAAQEKLIALAQDFPEDGPTATLLGRVLQYRDDPPPDDWDGVFVAKDK